MGTSEGAAHPGYVLGDVATLEPASLARRTEALSERNSWSREQLISHQSAGLRAALLHAVSSSAFHRERIGALVAQGAPLEEFPTMNKTLLMAEFDRIVADPRLTRAVVEQHVAGDRAGLLLFDRYRVLATGGSSGQRGVFAYDLEGWESAVANMRRLQRMLGLPAGAKAIGIGAPSPVHLTYRFNAEGRVGRPDVPRLSVTTPMPEVVAALNLYQPDLLSTYPSFVRRLAEEAEAGRLRIAPRVIRSVAEALSPDIKALVRRIWNVAVTNNYAATEAGIIGMECRHLAGIHLAEDLMVVEVVDENNRAVPRGTQGAKVLITPLCNQIIPLVRYELSDLVTLRDGPCACGSPLQRIEDIEGRSEEQLSVWNTTGQAVKVHAARLWFHLVRVEGIRQYQFIQLPKGIRIRLALFNADNETAVRAAATEIMQSVLRDLGAENAVFEIEIVSRIDRVGSGAKERMVAREPS